MRPAAACVALLAIAAPAAAQVITDARYEAPTTRYPHGVLGDTIEHGALVIETERDGALRIVLPQTRVFEDTEPRLADLDGDGAPEVVVVESHASRGARLAAYGPKGLKAATGWIGQRFRWLAPVAIADLDGDGLIEAAYIDRPHLAQTLRVVRLEGDALVEVASLPGVTNHRIGEEDIAGGLRDCGDGPEMILADPSWTTLLAVTFDGGTLTPREIGTHKDRSSFAAAMACEN